MGLTFSRKQKITSAIYEEFKKQRGDKPKDENFDYDYACFLENKITEMSGVGKPVTTSENSLHKHFVSKSFTAEFVVTELENCEHLDDAIMLFKQQM